MYIREVGEFVKSEMQAFCAFFRGGGVCISVLCARRERERELGDGISGNEAFNGIYFDSCHARPFVCIYTFNYEFSAYYTSYLPI